MGLLRATNFGFVARFFIKLTTCRATILLVLRDKLKVFLYLVFHRLKKLQHASDRLNSQN